MPPPLEVELGTISASLHSGYAGVFVGRLSQACSDQTFAREAALCVLQVYYGHSIIPGTLALLFSRPKAIDTPKDLVRIRTPQKQAFVHIPASGEPYARPPQPRRFQAWKSHSIGGALRSQAGHEHWPVERVRTQAEDTLHASRSYRHFL